MSKDAYHSSLLSRRYFTTISNPCESYPFISSSVSARTQTTLRPSNGRVWTSPTTSESNSSCMRRKMSSGRSTSWRWDTLGWGNNTDEWGVMLNWQMSQDNECETFTLGVGGPTLRKVKHHIGGQVLTGETLYCGMKQNANLWCIFVWHYAKEWGTTLRWGTLHLRVGHYNEE